MLQLQQFLKLFPKPAVNPSDHHLGNVNAAVTLVEYGDFECPDSRHLHHLIKRLLAEKDAELLFVFRHFPLRKIHSNSYVSAIAAEAAGRQGKYWEMHELILENQKWLNAHLLFSLADEIDLDIDRFTEDAKGEEISRKIKNDFETGVRNGVNETPALFVNGVPVLTYDKTYDSLLRAVFF